MKTCGEAMASLASRDLLTIQEARVRLSVPVDFEPLLTQRVKIWCLCFLCGTLKARVVFLSPSAFESRELNVSFFSQSPYKAGCRAVIFEVCKQAVQPITSCDPCLMSVLE